MKLLLFISFALLFSQCTIVPPRDVYKIVSIKSQLTEKILHSSEQIVFDRNKIILLKNINWDLLNDDMNVSNHLLFYDSTLRLVSACYFPADEITSIKDKIISGDLNVLEDKRKYLFRNDLPPEYVLGLNNIHKDEFSSSRKSDKIISKIEIDTNCLNVRVYAKKSTDMFAGFKSKTSDIDFLNNFRISDTLVIPLLRLHFDYYNNILFIIDKDLENNSSVKDEMIVLNKSIFDDFYAQLFKKFGKPFLN